MIAMPRPWMSGRYSRASYWRLVGTELAATAAVMMLYFLLRGLRPDSVQESVTHSLAIVRIEQRLGVFREVEWQETFLDSDFLMGVANFVYAWLHYPVMLAVALWLLIRSPERFRFIRNVLFVSAVIGILAYWAMPAAPPRLMALHGYNYGFVDTVHDTASNAHYFQPGPFVNDYAALPSFHFGWIALSAGAIWVNTRSRVVRAGAAFMAAVMWWAIVVTGNHYFFDMVFGALTVAFAWLAVRIFSGPRMMARLALVRG